MFLIHLLQFIDRKFRTRKAMTPTSYELAIDHSTRTKFTGEAPKVSIIIPTRDKAVLLRKCLHSILENTTYPNFEILVVDNMSHEKSTLELFQEIDGNGVEIISYKKDFNFSAICNYAAEKASGDILLFLNNDTQVLTSNWLENLVSHAIQTDVGLVGTVLLYPGGKIQHMGISLGLNGVAGHPNRLLDPDIHVPVKCFEVSAVTFACAMVSREAFLLAGGLDESLPSGYNDVDFSIRISDLGLRNVICTHATVTHEESQSRPRTFSCRGAKRATKDVLLFLKKHPTRTSDRFFTTRESV